MRFALALVALVLFAPVAAACNGLSPGDELISDGSRCTLAFLLAAPDGLYFATAGHCIEEGAKATNPDVGEFGVAVLRHLEPDTGAQTDGEPGEDFGLIRIHESAYDDLNPAVCHWGGPTGIYDAAPGSGGTKHHGYGLVLGDVGATRARQGANLFNDDNYAFYWAGAGVPGDSGSAVLSEDGRALGVLTHLRVSPDTNGGTHLLRGFEIARERGFPVLRLVLEGEDPVAVLRSMQDAPGEPVDQAEEPAPTPPTRDAPSEPTPQTKPTPSGTTTTTPPPADPGEVEGARTDEGANPVPAPGLALVLVVALAALARRRVTRL